MTQTNILTDHPPELTDSFTLYFKSSILVSRVRVVLTAYRRSLRPNNNNELSDFRLTPDFIHVAALASSMRGCFPRHLTDPTAGTEFGQVDVMLYAAHAICLLYV